MPSEPALGLDQSSLKQGFGLPEEGRRRCLLFLITVTPQGCEVCRPVTCANSLTGPAISILTIVCTSRSLSWSHIEEHSPSRLLKPDYVISIADTKGWNFDSNYRWGLTYGTEALQEHSQLKYWFESDSNSTSFTIVGLRASSSPVLVVE